MSQIYDMYRMTIAVKKEIRRLDKLEPQHIIDDDGFNVWHAPADNVLRLYNKYRPWQVPTEASQVLGDCIDAGYLTGDKIKVSHDDIGLGALTITRLGRKLIERTWFIFPTGLWQAWQEDNGKIFFTFMSAVLGLLTLIAGFIIKIAIL
ncbi:hypothetical protein EON76_04165 [bacterium]|nr:MAG: hypothetical protein EON76_04165 [bacterium]